LFVEIFPHFSSPRRTTEKEKRAFPFISLQSGHWLILPWIVVKFIFLAALAAFFITVVILMSVYKPDDEDTSEIIASGVVLAVITGKS